MPRSALPAELRLGWDQVLGRRLERSLLRAPAPGGALAEAAAAVGGVQAQVLPAAELALALRVAGATRGDVAAALWERGSLVKTWALRGTLHLLPAAELPLWMAATRAAAALDPRPAPDDLPAERVEAVVDAVRRALSGRCLTREELADAVAADVGAWAREPLLSPWGGLLRPAAMAGALAFGPTRGARVTFVRVDELVGGWSQPDPDEALAVLVRRFLDAYGPLAPDDVGRWVGVRPPAARRLVESLGDLVPVDVDGRPALVTAAAAAEPWQASARGTVHLLPRYDAYVIGCHPRDRLLAGRARELVGATGRGRFEGAVGVRVLLLDGVVGGVWEERRRAGRLEVSVVPAERLTAAQRRGAAVAVARVAAAQQAELALAFGSPA